MLISVVTVTRNNARTIAETIESVRAQTYGDVEHVVVDGASTDDTAEVARDRLGGNAVFVSEPDAGIYDAMNKGVGLATGDIIGTLNADDMYADTRVLERVADVFRDQSVDACHGDLLYVG